MDEKDYHDAVMKLAHEREGLIQALDDAYSSLKANNYHTSDLHKIKQVVDTLITNQGEIIRLRRECHLRTLRGEFDQ